MIRSLRFACEGHPLAFPCSHVSGPHHRAVRLCRLFRTLSRNSEPLRAQELARTPSVTQNDPHGWCRWLCHWPGAHCLPAPGLGSDAALMNGNPRLIVHGVTADEWTQRYGVEPYSHPCSRCGLVLTTTEPFAKGTLRGLRAPTCSCGNERTPYVVVRDPRHGDLFTGADVAGVATGLKLTHYQSARAFSAPRSAGAPPSPCRA